MSREKFINIITYDKKGKKMSGKKSKTKGNNGERELCKILEEYLGGSWVKTPSSGAFLGGSNKYRAKKLDESQIHTFRADIITPENLTKLVIESKNYSELPLHNMKRNSGIPIVNSWIKDLEHDAGDDNFAWICYKLKNKGWFIGFRYEDLQNYKLNNYLFYNSGEKPYVFTDLKEFLQNNSQKINEICK